jgi:nicotinic acid mononucleotide adenylyltransferase
MNHRIHPLTVAGDLDAVSATEVRRRIRQGDRWKHLVPGEIVPLVREIYGASGSERPLE